MRDVLVLVGIIAVLAYFENRRKGVPSEQRGSGSSSQLPINRVSPGTLSSQTFDTKSGNRKGSRGITPGHSGWN